MATVARDKAETAAQLLAAAYWLLDALPPFLVPADQADYGRLVEHTRAALGEEKFRVAWGPGAT